MPNGKVSGLGFAEYRTFFNTGFRYCDNFNSGNTGIRDITKYSYFLLGPPSPKAGVRGEGGVSDFCPPPLISAENSTSTLTK